MHKSHIEASQNSQLYSLHELASTGVDFISLNLDNKIHEKTDFQLRFQ